jgi:two-component system LytT family response regulator
MKDPISVLIVDDEPEARDLLAMLAARLEGVKVKGKAEHVDEAFQMVQERDPDLILLDIQMPVKSGFELINMLHERGMQQGYIFVTAYDEYAIEAIKASAFDYLLKPVDPGELDDAIDRFRNSREEKILKERIDQLLGSLGVGTKIKLNTRSGFLVISPEDVVCCTADGNYTKIFLKNGRQEIISSNLGTVEGMLDKEGFFRISRSGIINLKYLVQVDTKMGMCKLDGVQLMELKVARNRLGKLEALL